MNKLLQRQAYDLDLKVMFTKQRIEEFYVKMHGNVYVAFSGGKDSTVLLHLVRSIYPNVPAVFVDTGLEYPEIKEFVRTIDNVTWLKPKMRFDKVIEKYGHPAISKNVAMAISRYRNTKYETQKNLRKNGYDPITGRTQKVGIIPKKWHHMIDFNISERCCDVMKKKPFHTFEKETGLSGINGIMADESNARKMDYNKYGCFKSGMLRPIMFWLTDDIWNYLKTNNIPYSKIYDMGEKRTGCMFCMFGVHMEKEPNRFQRMKITHPKQYNYCINKLGCGKILDAMNVKY